MKSDYHGLTVSISQVQTLGLEEAVLLHCLTECSARHPALPGAQAAHWYTMLQRDIVRALPFWNAEQTWDIALRLCRKGVIECQRTAPGEDWRFCFPRGLPAAPPVSGRQPIAADWQPAPETLAELQKNHGIDAEFARAEVEVFRIYQRERGEAAYSWNNRFRDWVLRSWRERSRQQHGAMHGTWRPGQYALQALETLGIPAEFIEEAIPEFICYWMEKDDIAGTWDSKFINHIKKQWRRYRAELQCGREPSPMPADWHPSPELHHMLQMARIPPGFAEEHREEFIFYWRERGVAMPAWNALFFRHLKKLWAQRHGLPSGRGPQSWADFVNAHTDTRWRDVR